MKHKIIPTFIALALIAGAFLIGRKMPSKYDYIDLNKISETEITGYTVTVYTTTGDYYTFTAQKGE